MFKMRINTNSIKFKVFFIFIALSLIVISIGVFLVVLNITFFNGKYLRERLKSQLMTERMKFIGDREYMLKMANDIAMHDFKSDFIRKIFYPRKFRNLHSSYPFMGTEKISSVILIRLKDGMPDYVKKFNYKYDGGKILNDYSKFSGIISAKNKRIFTGFGRNKSHKLIELRVIYRFLHNRTGFIIVLNKHITSDYLRAIRLKNHMTANLGVYYGTKRSAISVVINNRYMGLGQSATEKQLLVFKNGKSIYTSVIVNGISFYIYNKPIRNYSGKIIGILGSGIERDRWFQYLKKIYYIPVLFFLGLAFFIILIFILTNKKFVSPFYDLLSSIEKIDPNNPQKLGLIDKYKNREIEYYALAKVITALNDAIIEKQEENSLIVSGINHFSKIISGQDDLNSIISKLINLIVEEMGYNYAWYGVLDEGNREVKITAAYNNDLNYTKNLILKYDGSKYSQNLAARAIASKNYVVINDMENDETIPLYKGRLLEHGFLSVGVFPLILYGSAGSSVAGLLEIYSDKKGAFGVIKAIAIFNLTNYVSYLMIYLKNLKRSLILSEMADQILFSISARHGDSRIKPDNQEFLNNLEDNLQTDFMEFIVYDEIKNEIVEGMFSKGWDYNLGKSSTAPTPTPFIRKRIMKNRLYTGNYQEDEFATGFFKHIGVQNVIIYAFKGTENRRYLAVTGVIKRKATFYDEDLGFFRDGINLFATYFEINRLFEKLDLSLELLENRENLINKMVEFGVVSINLTDNSVSLYNDYFAGIFNINKFLNPVNLDYFYDSIKPAFKDENSVRNIFEIYIKNKYVTEIKGVEIDLKSGIVLSIKSNLFLTKYNDVIRLLVFVNITDSKNYTKNIENLNKRLNIINKLSHKLSTVFTLEYALKTFSEGLCSIKNEKGGEVNSLHINIFDTVSKKTVTSLIYIKNGDKTDDVNGSKLPGKVIITRNNINYEDYVSNCKLLRNGEKKRDMLNDCEFHNTEGSYECFSLKIGEEKTGTVSVDSANKDFLTEEIISLIKEMINITSPVLAKLILIEANKEMAVTDALTGIHNRRYLYELAKREIIRAYRNSTHLSTAMLDIDNFKNINDNYGHQAGDAVLKEFAADLKNIVMRNQDIVTRYGGDEFFIILPDTDKLNAIKLMKKLRIFIKNKVYSLGNNVDLSITVSIGVSGIEYLSGKKIIKNNDDAEDILNRLLKITDENLYKAKNMGRDSVVG
ncbi:MAG TPA: diguanylate cyclase [bacterium]|nr:diguanylate cyclase [bacterium]